MTAPPLGFILDPLLLPLSSILPSRKTPQGLLSSRKYKQIQTSVETVGVIEPLSVSKPDHTGQYVLLDGHTRLLALKNLGFDKAPCLVATDDESYTYNNRIPAPTRPTTRRSRFPDRRRPARPRHRRAATGA